MFHSTKCLREEIEYWKFYKNNPFADMAQTVETRIKKGTIKYLASTTPLTEEEKEQLKEIILIKNKVACITDEITTIVINDTKN